MLFGDLYNWQLNSDIWSFVKFCLLQPPKPTNGLELICHGFDHSTSKRHASLVRCGELLAGPFLGLSVVSPYLVKTEYFGTHDESAVALGCQRARTDSEISTRMITNQMMKAMFFFLNRLIASADTCPFSMSFSATKGMESVALSHWLLKFRTFYTGSRCI